MEGVSFFQGGEAMTRHPELMRATTRMMMVGGLTIRETHVKKGCLKKKKKKERGEKEKRGEMVGGEELGRGRRGEGGEKGKEEQKNKQTNKTDYTPVTTDRRRDQPVPQLGTLPSERKK